MLRHAYLKYLLLGLAFGIADWHYLNALGHARWDALLGNGPLAPVIGIPLILALNWGIWLLPVVPVAMLEFKRTHSVRLAGLAAVLIWSAAILAYYLYYTLLLTFVGLPHMDFMLFQNRGAIGYWADWTAAFNRIIFAQFAEWIVVALVGGAVVGAGSAWLYGWWTRRRPPRAEPASGSTDMTFAP